MKYCIGCGKAIASNSKYCPNCGTDNSNNHTEIRRNTTYDNDPNRALYIIISALIPLVGLILFLVWKDEYKERAEACAYGALIGFFAQIILFICFRSSFGFFNIRRLFYWF
jgi:hypothetical protein